MKKLFQTIVGAVLSFLPIHLQGLDYWVQDLGTLGTDESYATGINNQNTIVGSVRQGNSDHSDFLWKGRGELVYLPHLHYPTQSPVVNNNNQVVSIFWHKTNYYFISNTVSKHIYIYNDDGSVEDIESPSGWKKQELATWQTPSVWDEEDLSILSFNDRGQVLVSDSSKTNKAAKFAIWENGAFKDIETSVISNAYCMNNKGVILGRKWVQKEGVNVPMLVLYNPANSFIVEIMRDINIITRKLNDLGQVIISQGQKDALPKGFLWDLKKGLVELEDFAPLAFNNQSQIIGFQMTGLQNKKKIPLMWTPSEVIPLAPFIGLDNPDSIWNEITSLDGINDNGYIIGQGMFDGKKHAFVLVPQ